MKDILKDNEILNTKKPTTEAEKLTQELLQPIVLHLLGYKNKKILLNIGFQKKLKRMNVLK